MENQYDSTQQTLKTERELFTTNTEITCFLSNPSVDYGYPQFRMEQVIFDHFGYDKRILSWSIVLTKRFEMIIRVLFKLKYADNVLYDFEYIGGPTVLI